MINKTELGENDYLELEKLQEKTAGEPPTQLMNPNIASLEIKGQQYNELRELSQMAGVDQSTLIGNPQSAPAVKATAQLDAISKKNPALGNYLAKPENQLTWWDKIDAIFKAKPEAFKGVPKFEDLGIPLTPSVTYLGESQATRGLGMADFIAQQSQEFNKWLSTAEDVYKARQAQVAKGNMNVLSTNPIVTMSQKGLDRDKTIQEFQNAVVEAKTNIQSGMMKDPNLALRTADNLMTIASYAMVGWATGGWGTTAMGIAEGGGIGQEKARQEGLSESDQSALGLYSAIVTGLSERLSFGFASKLAQTEFGKTILRDRFARGIAKYLTAGGTEVVEENVEALGHTFMQNRFGIDSQYALETDPAIFLSAMLFHGAHQARVKMARANGAQALGSHLDNTIAFADSVSENIPSGDLAKLLNARDQGLSLTFDAIELDVATEGNAELRQKIISVVGEQKYLDAVARGDKVEISIGDYVESLRSDHETLKGLVEYENTKISASVSEQTRATAMNEIVSLSQMQNYISAVQSLDVENNATYQRLSSAMREQLSQGVSFKSETAKENYIEFFSRIATHLVEMQAKASEQAGVAFDIDNFISSYMPTIISAPSGGNRAREFMKQVIDAFAKGKGIADIRRGMSAQDLLAMSNLPTSAEGDADLMKSYRALVQAGYLQDVETDEEAMSLLTGALAEPTYLPEGSEALSTYQEIADALETLTNMGKTMEQAYQNILDSLAISDPTISFDSLRQMREEFNTAIAEAEFNQTALTYGGKEAYALADTELTYELWVKVRTPRFKSWFGDWENDPANASKVVHPRTGEPLVVYHGSKAKPENAHLRFDRSEAKGGRPFFASDDQRIAETYIDYDTTALEVKYVDNEFKVFTNPDSWGDVDMEGIGKLGHLMEGDEERYRTSLADALEDGVIYMDKDSRFYYYTDTNEPVYEFTQYVGNNESNWFNSRIGKYIGIGRASEWKELYTKEVGDAIVKGNLYELFLNIRNPMVADFKGKNWNSYEGKPRLNYEDYPLMEKIIRLYNNGLDMEFDTTEEAQEFLVKVLSENATVEESERTEILNGRIHKVYQLQAFGFGIMYHYQPQFTAEEQTLGYSQDRYLEFARSPKEIKAWVEGAVRSNRYIETEIRTTNDLATEAEDMGYDGTIFQNVIDSAGIHYLKQSTVYTFQESSQAKSIYNVGSWSPSNKDILRQMYREDYRKQFVEAEIALNGADGYRESGSNLSYAKWVASHTKDYKNGIPWFVVAENETDISTPLYQHSYKGLPTDRWFFNPVVKGIRDFPAKAFGEGGNKVATIKQWIDKLKSANFNKDFMARTRIISNLEAMQADYEESKRLEKENPKENALPNDFGKLSKSDVIEMLGNGFELVADIVSAKIPLDINFNPDAEPQKIRYNDMLITEQDVRKIIYTIIDELGITDEQIDQNGEPLGKVDGRQYSDAVRNPYGSNYEVTDFLKNNFTPEVIETLPDEITKASDVYFSFLSPKALLDFMRYQTHHLAYNPLDGKYIFLQENLVMDEADAYIKAQQILDGIADEIVANTRNLRRKTYKALDKLGDIVLISQTNDAIEEMPKYYKEKYWEAPFGKSRKEVAVQMILDSTDVFNDKNKILYAMQNNDVSRYYYKTSLDMEKKLTKAINIFYNLIARKMSDNGYGKLQTAVKHLEDIGLLFELYPEDYATEMVTAERKVKRELRNIIFKIDNKAIRVFAETIDEENFTSGQYIKDKLGDEKLSSIIAKEDTYIADFKSALYEFMAETYNPFEYVKRLKESRVYQNLFYNASTQTYTSFEPEDIFNKIATVADYQPVRALPISEWEATSWDGDRALADIKVRLSEDFIDAFNRDIDAKKREFYANRMKGAIKNAPIMESPIKPEDGVVPIITLPEYIEIPDRDRGGVFAQNIKAVISNFMRVGLENTNATEVSSISIISNIENPDVALIAFVYKTTDDTYRVEYRTANYVDEEYLSIARTKADVRTHGTLSGAIDEVEIDTERLLNTFTDDAVIRGIYDSEFEIVQGEAFEDVKFINRYITNNTNQNIDPQSWDMEVYAVAPVTDGFSSLDEAIEYIYSKQIVDRVQKNKEYSYSNYEKEYVKKAFASQNENKMIVKYSQDYAKTAKQDPSVVDYFNIVLRLPNSKVGFINTAHTQISDGYDYNITCLVMGNVRNFVRPDGTVVRAVFIEEVQSDWEQKSRKGFKSQKEKQEAYRMGVTADFISRIDWYGMTDEEFAKHDKFITDWGKAKADLWDNSGYSKIIASLEQAYETATLEKNDAIRKQLLSDIQDKMRQAVDDEIALDAEAYSMYYNNIEEFAEYIDNSSISLIEEKRSANILAYARKKGIKDEYTFIQKILKTSSGEAFDANDKLRKQTDFYISQEPAMQMVRAIVMMASDPAMFAKWGVTDVVFGSAKTVSVHNQAVNYIPKNRKLVLSPRYGEQEKIDIALVDVNTGNEINRDVVYLWNLGNSIGTDMAQQYESHYLNVIDGKESRKASFVWSDADGKIPENDQNNVYFDIGKVFSDTPVLGDVHKNAIGLVAQYDKKAPKTIERTVSDMGGVVEKDYRMEFKGNLADNDSSKLKANEVPLIGFQIAPLQKYYTENPDIARAPLFQKEILVEGAYDRMNRVIRHFNKDNPTTLLHEGAHWYLDILQAMANGKDGEKNYPMFYKIAKEFQFNPLTPIPDEAHERFARAFEQFMLEGKTTSDDAKLLMANMKEEFKRQYMNAQSVGENSPAMDEIFGSIISADNAVAQAYSPPAFTAENAKLLSMTEPQIRAYHRMKAMEAEDASSEVRQKMLDIVQARKTQRYKDDLKQQTKFALDKMSMDDMDFLDEKIASYFLTGRKPNGQSINIPHVRLDKKATIEAVGEELASQLPSGVFASKKGVKPVSPNEQVILNLFGMGNATELVKAIIKGQDYKDKAKAEGMANADALAEQADESAQALAEIAVHNNRRINNLLFEVDTIAKSLNSKPPTLNQIRDAVDRDIATLSLKELSKYRTALLAERKAGKSALQALNKGDLPTALNEKLRELVNAIRYDRMLIAHQEMTKKVSWIKDKGKKKSYQKIGKSGAVFVDAYESVLGYLGMIDNAQTKSMFQVIQDIQDMGYIVQASDELVAKIDNRQPRFLDEMTAEEVNEIYDLFRNIRMYGRNTLSILIDGRRVDREKIVSEIVNGIQTNLTGKPVPFDPETQGLLERSNSYRKQAFADLYRMDAIAGWIDGENTQGMFHSAIWQPFNDAQARKNEILNNLFVPLGKLNDKLAKDIGSDAMRKEYTMPWKDEKGNPVVVTRQWMIAFALNSGNASSTERLSNQFSQSDINYVLSNLTKAELEYVQSVWDLLDTLWSDIVALERRMTGVTPERVVPIPRTLRLQDGSYVTLKGGYFPLVYDRESKEYADAFGSDADQLLGKGVMPASTSHGFTKSRAKTVKIPIKFDLMNILSHIEEVAHDLSHREAVVNAWQLMNNPEIKGAFIENGRIAIYNMIRSKIKQIAQNDSLDVKGLSAIRKLSRHLRSGISASAMGLSTVTMTKQLIGLSQTVARLSLASDSSYGGFKYTAQGMADSLSRGFREQAMAESGLMADRMNSVNLDVKRQMQRRVKNTMGLGKVSAVASPFIWLKDRAFVPMAWVQFNFVDMPTYLGAKRLGAKQGLTGKALVNFAEAQVRRSQGAGDVKDVALVENVAFLELFITFYSYASAYLNEQITILKKAGKAKKANRLIVEAPTIATSLAMLTLTPMVLDTLISMMLGKADLPDDDEDEEYWLTLLKFFGVKYAFEATTFGIPLVRDVGSTMARAVNEEPQFQSSRGLDVVTQNLTKLYNHAKDAVDENEEVDGKKLVKDLATTVTILTGIPMNKPLSHLDSLLYELENGDGDFGSAEFWLNFYGGSRKEEEQ